MVSFSVRKAMLWWIGEIGGMVRMKSAEAGRGRLQKYIAAEARHFVAARIAAQWLPAYTQKPGRASASFDLRHFTTPSHLHQSIKSHVLHQTSH